MQDKLDGFGMSILFVFAITICVCFWKGFWGIDSQYKVLSIDSVTKKIASYTILLSFVVMLVFSIWEICGTPDSHTESMRNGAASIPGETLSAVLVDFSKAVMLSLAAVAVYWYVRMCFILFSGRMRRLGIEVELSYMTSGVSLTSRKRDSQCVNWRGWLRKMMKTINQDRSYDIAEFVKKR